jgi:hypothetical protein
MYVCPLALRVRAHSCESISANLSQPFLDSHPVFSAPIDVAIGAFDRVEVETTPSEVIRGLTSTFIRHFVIGLLRTQRGPLPSGYMDRMRPYPTYSLIAHALSS